MDDSVPQWIFTLLSYEPHICAPTFIVTLVHLFVLTRKGMRDSSTNVIMIGIAVFDLYSMGYPVVSWVDKLIKSWKTCRAPDSYLRFVFAVTSDSVLDDTKRCTVFLGLSMSIIRVVVLKSATENRSWKLFENASGPTFGWKTVIGAFCVSSVLSICQNLRLTVKYFYEWKPRGSACNGSDWPANYSQPYYIVSGSELFYWRNSLLARIYQNVDGIVSKIIPSILFPILTLILIRQLRQVAQNRERLFSNDKKDKSALTTKLVTYTTIAFTATLMPVGISHVLQTFCYNNDCQTTLQGYTFAYQLLNPINSISHFIFCILVSTQYRNTVRSILGVEKAAASAAQNTITSSTRSNT